MLKNTLRSLGPRLFTKIPNRHYNLSVFNKDNLLNSMEINDVLLDAFGIPEETCRLKSIATGFCFSILPESLLTLIIPKNALKEYINKCSGSNNSITNTIHCEAAFGIDLGRVGNINQNEHYYLLEIRGVHKMLIFNIEQKYLEHFASFVSSSIKESAENDLKRLSR